MTVVRWDGRYGLYASVPWPPILFIHLSNEVMLIFRGLTLSQFSESVFFSRVRTCTEWKLGAEHTVQLNIFRGTPHEFDLIRVQIGHRSCLSSVPVEVEWTETFATVVEVCQQNIGTQV